jgi:hypothetical protein
VPLIVLLPGHTCLAAGPSFTCCLPACPLALPADSNRRQSFVHHKLALGAASKELGEATARVTMERELAQAQQQVRAAGVSSSKQRQLILGGHAVLRQALVWEGLV